MSARRALKTLVGMALITFAASRAALAQATNPWTAAAPYPTYIIRYAFAQVGEDMYVISGKSIVVYQGVNAIVNIMTRYNVTADVWTPLADIPVGSNAPAGAYFGGKIYVADGYLGANLLRIYDIATNTWSAGPARPAVIDSFGAAAGAFNGKVYVVGGGSAGPSSVLSIYDIASNTWSAGPASPSPYQLGGYAQIGQFLYLIGSFTSTPTVNTTVSMRLDMATNTWSTGPVWTPARADFALAAAGTKLIAIGGDLNGRSFFDPSAQVDELDTSTWPAGAWVPSPDNLPSPRQSNRAGFVSTGRVGGEIWSTGGATLNIGYVYYLYENLFRAQAPITNAGATIISSGPNGVLDPGEAVMVALGVQNTGGACLCTTTALTGTLQAGGGVTGPSGPQNYGVLCSGGPAVLRNFAFTIDPALPCGSIVTASLAMTDGAANYGTLTYTFATGVPVVTWSQPFDALVAPALPAGWVATNAQGPAPLWVTSTTTPDTALNDAFVDDPLALASDKRLDTPGISITSTSAQVSFFNNYDLESQVDGGVLEVSSPNINAGAFTDITNAAVGGSFVIGGYNDEINPYATNSISGRRAWSGYSGGYIHTVANLGPNVAGQTINMRWRMGSDSSGTYSNLGWRIDTIAVTESTCAPTLLVTTANDHDDGVCDAADCTLREAILAANSRARSTIGFASGVTGTIQLASALPTLSSTIALQGPGANVLTVRRNIAGSYRVFTINSSAVVNLSGLTITNGNVLGSSGGGINNAGTLTLTSVTISGNTATNGGGIFNAGTVTITNSTISGNTVSSGVLAGSGGGIHNSGGTVTIVNSTISGNSANGPGGNSDSAGGIFTNVGTVTITDSTVSGNSGDLGGGIRNPNGGIVTSKNTIIALNTSASGPDVNGPLTSQGFNLVGNASGATITPAQVSDQLGTAGSPINPFLGPLQDNGGMTLTRALLFGSPAIDKGHSSGSLTDQRGGGFPRTVDDPAITNASGGDGTDIGAFELGGSFGTNNPVSCDDGNACTDDSCNPFLGCFHTANAASCDDGNACTTGDACGLSPAILLSNFDGVAAPALPAGWISTVTPAASAPWTTTTAFFVSAPNSATTDTPDTGSDKTLDSPAFVLTSGTPLEFDNRYNLEPTYDGAVLEIKIGAGAFTDIVTAGGSFVTGGYNATISAAFGSPIGGRAAWSGLSAGFVHTKVNLPVAALGESVVLRWRVASDNSAFAAPPNGQWVDSVQIASSTVSCQPGGTPTPAPPETQGVVAAADKVTYSWSPAASATRYDVVRGKVGALPVGPGGSDEVCFDNLPGTSLVDPTVPAPGGGFWYLSRGESACGNGSYGQQSNGAPRITTTCP